MTNTDKPKEGVVERLKKYKENHSGMGEFTLPDCDVKVTFPKFQNHGKWMRAERLAKGDPSKTKTIYLQEVCLFEGEKLTLDEFSSLLPTGDVMELLGEVLGGDDDLGND